MLNLLYQFVLPIAQVAFDDPDTPAPPPPPPASHRLSFSGFQKGLQDTNVGTAHDRHFELILLGMVAIIACIALILHLRQRQKAAGPLDSVSRLARELSRDIRFPFASRFFLGWVARSSGLPIAALLLSARTFDKAVDAWSDQHTFSLLRRWGHARLQLLKPNLFEPPPPAAASA